MSPSRHKRSASTSSPPRAPPPPPPVMAPPIRRMGSSGPYEPPPPPVIEGWLRKPGSRLSTHKIWNERYFVLRGSTLSYYVRRADVKPRGAFQLTPDCTVSEVYLCSRKDKGNHLNVQRQQEEDKREVANVGPRISPVPSSHGSVEEGGEGDVSGGAVAAVESSQTNKKEKKEKKKSRGRETMYCIKLTWDNPNGGSERSDSKAAAPTGMDSAMSSAHLQQQQQQQQDGGANGTRLSQHRPSLHVDESNNNNNHPTTTASGAASPIPEEGYEDQESPVAFRQQQHPPTTIAASFSADEYDTTGMGPTPAAATAAASNSRNSRESTPIRRTRSVETFSNNKSPTAAATSAASALSASMTTTPSSRKSRHHRRKTSDGPPAALLQQRPSTPPRRSRTDEGEREQGGGSEVRSPNTSTSPVPGEGVVLPIIPNLDHPIASRSNLSKQSTNGNNNGQAGSSGVKTPPRSGSGVSSVAAAAAAASTTAGAPSTDIVPADQRAQQCGIQKHYAQQVQQQNQLSALHQEELLHSMYKAARKAANRKTKKRIVKGSKIAVAAGAVVTVGVFTAGVGLAAGMVVLGVTAAAGGTGAAASVNKKKSDGKVTTLVLAAVSYEEANRWKKALEASIVSESMNMGDSTWANLFAMEGRDAVSAMVPTEGGGGGKRGVVVGQRGLGVVAEGGGGTAAVGAAAERAAVPVREKIRVAEDGRAGVYVEPGTRWRPLEGGWATLLGTGAHGLRIFREEKEDDVPDYYGLAGVGMTFVRAGKEMARMMFSRRQNAVSENRTCPPLKAQIILNASPLDAFMCLMSSAKEHRPDVNVPPPLEFAPNSGQRASFRIVERIDDHMDVIHLVFRPLYLFPSWTTPRDFVLFRYWRFETDGTYIVCYDSVQHRECPPTPNYVRGELHGVYTIAPRKKSRSLSSNQLRRVTRGGSLPATQQSHPEYECLLTHVVQVDPRGWVPIVPFPPLASQGYGEAFSVSALLQLLDVRDALDSDRFVDVSLDMQPKPMHIQDFASSLQREQQQEEEQKQPPSPTSLRRGSSAADVNRYVIGRAPSAESDLDEDEVGSLVLDEEDTVNYDIKYSMRELPSTSLLEVEAHKTISSHPEPLITDWWAEPDANSFRVRGKTYKKDKKKINAGNSLARLVAVDIVEVDAHIMNGFCNHPKERVQQALMRERRNRNNGLDSDAPPYTIVINIVLPGPPLYHMVFFYAVDDMSTIDGTNGTPESRLASQFFFGDSDKFRDKTFKLIPHIVAGNFMVKKAVGSTPAIMGMKLKQTYVRSDRFFEILLDVGSSAVAAGVIRLTSSYAKLIVVDMAFLLEGDDETVLPEKVLGCVRLKNVEFGPKLRFVEAVDDD